MHPKLLFKPLLFVLLLLFATTACNHYMSPYDQLAYAQTTALKVDVLNLIDKSTESYTAHQAEVDKVTSDIRKAIEYEKHRPNNNVSVMMWNHILDSSGQSGIVGRYLASWKSSGTKSQTLINEVKPQVSEGFDLIADLESQKIKSSDARISTFINK